MNMPVTIELEDSDREIVLDFITELRHVLLESTTLHEIYDNWVAFLDTIHSAPLKDVRDLIREHAADPFLRTRGSNA